VELCGHTVPAGSAMMLLVASANRDEQHWDDGERYDVKRKVNQQLTFGLGPHYCLGAALARLEGRIALAEILKRFPEWEVDWDRAERAHTSTVRGWEKLPVLVP